MSSAKAFAKINLALVVGQLRADGKHEVVTVLQAVDLHDDVELVTDDELTVEGFVEDALVRAALEALAEAAGVAPRWRVSIEKRIPVAAGLGGGSSDAAAALRLANASLANPLPYDELHGIAARLGADVPFFLRGGTQLGTGDGSDLTRADLPTAYAVVLVVSRGSSKESTAAVYRRFDERGSPEGFDARREALFDVLASSDRPADLAQLPPNDLASSPLAAELENLGAFRADVTGAGPAVYGLFERQEDAQRAARAVERAGRAWLCRPVLHW